VLAAAVREFAASGFAGARVDAIAERAGVNKQALYYHFGSKEQLFQAALASIYDQFHVVEPDWASGLSPVAAMEQFVGQMFDFMGEHQDANAMIADENRLHGSHLTPEVRQRVRRAVEPMIAAIAGILARGQAQGVFSPAVDATQLYLTIISLCMFSFANAFTLSAIVGHDLLGEAALAARRKHVTSFVVAGLRT
jgi:TetR/AcrR family transcriptional regulator